MNKSFLSLQLYHYFYYFSCLFMQLCLCFDPSLVICVRRQVIQVLHSFLPSCSLDRLSLSLLFLSTTKWLFFSLILCSFTFRLLILGSPPLLFNVSRFSLLYDLFVLEMSWVCNWTQLMKERQVSRLLKIHFLSQEEQKIRPPKNKESGREQKAS